jgi:hypothetical protein
MKKIYKKLLKKYLVHLIILFFIANTSIALLIFTKAANEPCMNQSQIDADPRCLYVYQNDVYEMGTRSRPHKGHDCGINVDSIMPNLHFMGSVLSKFNNTKRTSFCSQAVTPTENPTQQPTQQPTVEPTANNTSNPTSQATQQPTTNPVSNPTAKSTAKATTEATTQPTSEPTVQSTATASSISYSGNSFGEILGKPDNVRSDLSVVTSDKPDLTKISKPITYISLLGLIASILLILF